MRALVIEHDPICPAGTVGDRLEEHGWDLTRLAVVPAERCGDPAVDHPFPDPTRWDLIVAMGARWSVNDAAILPWITPELAMLRQAHDAGLPVLGICFGGQALAAALGGGVERAPRIELGWTTVESTQPSLIGPGPWFEYHTDRWITPSGAVEIARTGLCPQAFRIGRSLAVQFHPEVTVPRIEEWIEQAAPEHLESVDPEALLDRTRALGPAAERRAHALVDLFLDHAGLPRKAR